MVDTPPRNWKRNTDGTLEMRELSDAMTGLYTTHTFTTVELCDVLERHAHLEVTKALKAYNDKRMAEINARRDDTGYF